MERELLEQYLARVDANGSMTNETKATIREHLTAFVALCEQKEQEAKEPPAEEHDEGEEIQFVPPEPEKPVAQATK